MTIACLGWGSLIWRREKLPVIEPWQDDGPDLPVEFGRQSRDGHITLVIEDGLPVSRVLWAKLDVADLDAAREALRRRERTSHQNVAHWSRNNGTSRRTEAAVIEIWAARKPEIEAVVWTALPPKFNAIDGYMPSGSDVVEYLSGLTGEQHRLAEEYVRKAPLQIRTPYRAAIERALGWTPLPATGVSSS